MSPDVVPNPNPVIEEDILSRRLMAVAQIEPPETVTAQALALLARYPGNLAALHIQGCAPLDVGKAAEAAAQLLRSNPDGMQTEAIYHDTLARIDVALGRLDDAYANYSEAMRLEPDLSRTYARSLSGLGFLPLSKRPAAVLTPLRRCLDVKKNTWLMKA